METLRRTVGRLCPLVLPLKQKSETERGPTLLAHVSFTSMFTSIHINTKGFHLCDLFPLLCLWLECWLLSFSYVLFCLCRVCLLSVCLCVCVSNGRAVHYNGSSLLQWKSVRLDVALLPGEMGENVFSPYTIFLLFYLVNLEIHTLWYGFELLWIPQWHWILSGYSFETHLASLIWALSRITKF